MTIYREDLERVYALIEKPEAWTKGEFARNALGKPTNEYDDDAARWCLDGAAMRVIPRDRYNYSDFSIAVGDENPIAFNDTHTHAEVLALLKQAIERAPAREQQP